MILVTGAAGIVGRSVCSALNESSIPYVPLTHHKPNAGFGHGIVVDLVTPNAFKNINTKDISCIIHLAAAVPHSINYPDTDHSAELTKRMDLNILSLQRSLGVPLIYMSTCGLYDRLDQSAKHEDDTSKIKIISPYFSAKWQGEQMFQAQGQCTVLRLAAPVGSGLKPNLVLSRFIDQARSGGAINLWGSGAREQNFIDTGDVADLILKILRRPIQTLLNVASVTPVTMYELAKIVVSVVGNGSIVFSEKPDPLEGESARYSIEKAYHMYGWNPQIDLKTSCEKIFHENFNLNL